MNPTCINQKYKSQAIGEIIKNAEDFIPYVVLTESHLSENIFDAEIHIENYNIYRADRVRRKQGGTAIYMHEDLVVNEKEIYSDSVCESIMLKNNNSNFILIGLYKPPTADNLDLSFKNCIQAIDQFINKHSQNSDITIMGDFNLPNIKWDGLEIKKSRSTYEKNCAKILLNFLNKHLLVQLVHETTRADKNTLDLIATNNQEYIHNIIVEKTSLSDHDIVHMLMINHFKINPNYGDIKENEQNPFDELNLYKANWADINSEISKINWEQLFDGEECIVKLVEVLEQKIIKILKEHTPSSSEKSSKRKNIPRHRNLLIKRCRRINSKINHYKYVKKNQSNARIDKLLQEKSSLEERIKISIENDSQRNEEKIISRIKINPKAFYSYAKRNSKVKSKIGPLSNQEGKLESEAHIMANMLQNQYLKVFSNPTEKTEFKPKESSKVKIHDIQFSTKDIENAIKSIPTNAAAGPDRFPAIVLKNCKQSLAKPLYLIWRKSLDTGQIPSKYLEQTIIPIFKKGSKADPANYRPVSLTSHIIKLFERILRIKIVQHIESQGLISPNQYGFCSGKSCMTQLLNHFEGLLELLETNSNADVLYLDFAKAFDKVDHAILLEKLKSFGIEGKIHLWLKKFLSDRKQYVLVNGRKSRGENVLSGVPQGTVLGPLFFIIYINDINNVINHCRIKIFADDSKLIKSVNNLEDKNLMEEDIKSVMDWAKNNKMELNKLKFQLLQHGNNNDLKTPYKIDQQVEIQKSKTVKDLGVNISENLSFDEHITKITNEAKRFAGWIFRVFKSRRPEIILLLYNTYVRPRLEYCSPLWSPYQKRHQYQIEAIQRTVTSRILGTEGLNYWERLKYLKIPSLQRRRERYQIIHIWKIAKSLIPNDLNLQFYNTSRYGQKCKIPKYNYRQKHLSTLKFNSFFSRGPALFNILPEKIKSSKSLSIFKSNLQNFLDKIPDNPPTPNYVGQNSNSIVEWVNDGNDHGIGQLPEDLEVEDPAVNMVEPLEVSAY